MNIQNKYNVALYLRLSRDDNDGNKESMSISNQRALLKEYVRERGWSIEDIYIDDGYSGTTFDRPEFKRMISDINERRINCVITKDLSRFGRNYAQVGYYTEEFFLEKNVRFIAINDNVDTMKEDNDIAPFKNILNEMYAKDISRKVRSARKVNARQGKFMGSQVPYGYKRSPLDKHQLVSDPEVAPIVKMIYEMSEKGYSKREIAVKLNSLCVLSPAAYYYVREGKPSPKPLEEMMWNANTLYTLIANPVYRGDMVQGRRKVQSYKTKRREIVPEDNWIIVENTHEAIVDRSTWKKVQSDKRTNRDPKTTANSDTNIFRGIIRCADCGSAMCFNTKYHYGEKTHFYRCSRYISKGKEACASHCIAEDLLKRAVLFDIQNHIKMIESEKDDLIEKLSALKYEFEQDSKTDVTAKINKTKKRIAEINHMVKQLFEEKVTGSIPETMYKTMVAQYCDEKDDLCAELDNLEKALDNKENEEVDILRWVDNMLAFVNIKELDRDTVLTLIDHIEVHEAERINGKKQFHISVFYKFVGNINCKTLEAA